MSLCDIGNSTLNQAALELFITSGLLDKHCRDIRTEYESRMVEMNSFTETATMMGLKLSVPHTGFFSYLTLPKEISSNRLAELLKVHQISVAGTQDMFLPCFFRDNSLRISLCSLEKTAVSHSLSSTFECIEKVMNSAKKSLPHEDIYIQ